MSQPPEHIEPTGSIEPAEVPPEVLAALQKGPPPVPAHMAPPQWSDETQAAVRRIGETLAERCPNWAWSPWHFTPTEAQVHAALIEYGYKAFDATGEDIAHDPEGKGRAQIQTVNWDAHYRGSMADASKMRVVSDGRPENGGIFPIITVGTPDPEMHGEDIAMMLESWERRYATIVVETAEAPAPRANGSMPVSGAMAWACDLCRTVVRQAADGTMPSFVCPGCGATQRWRQPTMDELANVSPAERAALGTARPFAIGLPVAQRQGDNDFYATQGAAPGGVSQPALAAFAQQNQMAPTEPDPETRAVADISWLLQGLPSEARSRVVRYIRDRWS